MKTTNILLLGIAAVGAFFLLKGKGVAAQPDSWAGGANAPFLATAITPSGETIKQKISSVKEGVDFMNTATSTGATLQRTSKTLQSNVSANVGGQALKGDIAQLAIGKPVFIAISGGASRYSSAPVTTTSFKSVSGAPITIKSVPKTQSIAYKLGYIK